MSISFQVEQRTRYAVVRVDGEPALEEFLDFIAQIGAQSQAWPTPRLLVDLRSIRSLKSFTEHYAIGGAVARHMAHLNQVASVVPADRITRASEKTAQKAGVNLAVFTSEGGAIAWLTGAAA
ncbi:STAS/SEC14 domain-containing protein [uncultured Ramlibacter sp.]|uniref:STAS/SEC14 domain-containing protein n=1 Tax=uncultured Ramlibacter sp. TaxID=260755 RepID=UPI002637889D|nr:STAS/SEC14 domain-containing protein [uncultured Ramlibacter sp.]